MASSFRGRLLFTAIVTSVIALPVAARATGPVDAPERPVVSASALYLVELQSGRVLLEQNAAQPLPPASLKSTEANLARPGPAPGVEGDSDAGSAPAVSRTGSSTEASGRRLMAGWEVSLGRSAWGSAPGGIGGVPAECVTSLGKSRGGR